MAPRGFWKAARPPPEQHAGGLTGFPSSPLGKPGAVVAGRVVWTTPFGSLAILRLGKAVGPMALRPTLTGGLPLSWTQVRRVGPVSHVTARGAYASAVRRSDISLRDTKH